MESTRLGGNELIRMLEQAVDALKDRSLVLERAPKMSKKQLDNEIDKRIIQIAEGSLSEEDLEQAKVEARTLALLRLRRNM